MMPLQLYTVLYLSSLRVWCAVDSPRGEKGHSPGQWESLERWTGSEQTIVVQQQCLCPGAIEPHLRPTIRGYT
ncbi:hypothetical protein BD626DRAFT_504369 [Schizophyllum amplum]|uniref:Secreted protein n=1 Tax=Schizophyllum amplum TaxID=97359 RepID=A0A550C6W8_9AGAR|nr:hypothetical protein BD626DRAFT_504369 [Auriculariopsis ampla]